MAPPAHTLFPSAASKTNRPYSIPSISKKAGTQKYARFSYTIARKNFAAISAPPLDFSFFPTIFAPLFTSIYATKN
jgi:hypothetical protein